VSVGRRFFRLLLWQRRETGTVSLKLRTCMKFGLFFEEWTMNWVEIGIACPNSSRYAPLNSLQIYFLSTIRCWGHFGTCVCLVIL
jgi:hypothetical protein